MHIKTLTVFLALLVFPVSTGAAIRETGDAAGQALREAAGYYGQGRLPEALSTCIAALKKNPLDEKLYAYALEILPEGPSGYNGPLRAITDKAFALKSGGGVYYLGRCKLDREDGQFASALSNCRKARELDPVAWPIYRELGLTYSGGGDGVRAVETLAQGAELYPGSHLAWYYLAAEYEKQNNAAAAVKNYRKALDLLRTSADAGPQSARIREKINRILEDSRVNAGPKKAGAGTAIAAPGTGSKPAAAPRQVFEACMAAAEGLKKADDPAGAEKKFASCAALAPLDPRPKMERAELLMRLGKYEAAAEEYLKSAGLFGKRDQMAAYCRLKAAQAFFKSGDFPKAILYYGKALEANGGDLNAMLGLAEAYEAGRDLRKAGDMYARVLKAEPANAKARGRLEEINFSLLSDAQLAQELRDREAADEKKTAAAPEDLKLLKAIRLAERNGAVDYLSAKTPNTRGLITEKQDPDHVRLLLTLAGFKSYQSYLTRDAVSFFEKKTIPLREIFTLRDLTGLPIFNPGGRLTPEGMQAYWLAKTGVKSWLMHYETVASSPEGEKLNAQAGELLKAGYREIFEPEYLWLMKATSCPDDILQAPPCGIKMLTAPGQRRYFLCYSETALCSTKANQILAGYVERYRNGDTWVPETTRTTAFFGTGGGEKRRFCHNDKLWTGD